MRQPWYPVQELYGLIFAYMGPPEKKPVLPRYECLEKMDDGEFVEADDSSIGGGGPPTRCRGPTLPPVSAVVCGPGANDGRG